MKYGFSCSVDHTVNVSLEEQLFARIFSVRSNLWHKVKSNNSELYFSNYWLLKEKAIKEFMKTRDKEWLKIRCSRVVMTQQVTKQKGAVTRWKVCKYRVFSSPHFPAFGRSISPYSVRMRENTDQKKRRIWTLFTQCVLREDKSINNNDSENKSKKEVYALDLANNYV